MCVINENDVLGRAIVETKHEVEQLKIQIAVLETNMRLLLGVCSAIGVALAGVLVRLVFI